MGILDSLNPFKRVNIAEQGVKPHAVMPSIKSISFDGINLPEVNVEQEGALSIPSIYDGIRSIGQGLGSLSLVTYLDTEAGRQKAKNHRLYKMLAKRPNRYMSRIEFIERLVADAILWGKGYAYYNRETKELIPLDAEYTGDGHYKGEHYVVSKVNGKWVKFYGFEVIILSNFMGLSIIDLFCQTLGVNVAQERYVAKFFGNGGRMGGKLIYKGELDEEEIADISEKWEAKYGGAKNAHKDMILGGGEWDYISTAFSPEQAQLLSTRQYSVVEVARILGIPVSKLKDLSKANYNSLELQAQDFYDNCLRQWAIRLESEINYKLFALDDEHYSEFLFESLLRADSKTKADVYGKYLTLGIMSLNEVRQAQNLPLVEGGDLNLIQLNMTTHQALSNELTKGEQVQDEEEQNAIQQQDRDKAIRDRLRLDERLEQRLEAFMSTSVSEQGAVDFFIIEKAEIEALIERELDEDLTINEDLIRQYVKFFIARMERGTTARAEAVRYRNAVTRWLYELSNKGTKIEWIGGELNGVVINKLDSYPINGKSVKHPDATLVGEIFLS